MSAHKIFQAIIYWPIFLFLKIFFKFQVEGQKNLNGIEKDGLLFCSNHLSYFDGPICAAAMPCTGFYPSKFFPIRFLVYRAYCEWNSKKNPIPQPFRFLAVLFVRLSGGIPVDKEEKYLYSSMQKAIRVLCNNGFVWIFPQGKRKKNNDFKNINAGIAFLHQKTHRPIVPVGIIMKEGKITIKIGRPFCIPRRYNMRDGGKIIKASILDLLK